MTIVLEQYTQSQSSREGQTDFQVELVSARDLTADRIAVWQKIIDGSAALDSPLFHPCYTQLIAAHRENIEVAVLRDHNNVVGFFPFQRDAGNIGRPVGHWLSDFQGLIASRPLAIDATTLVRQCQLKAWHFHHALASQTYFDPHQEIVATSPFMDLSNGFEAYERQRREAGSKTIKQTRRKIRKIEREVGPLRFVPHTTDEKLFEQLIRWKIEQYRRIRSVNHLAETWKIDVLREITRTDVDGFAGRLSALYAGDQVVALHLGMISRKVMHCWFPAYSTAVSRYSPGLILWVRLAQEAESMGIHRIDLGRGNERFKTSLQSGTTQVLEGSVDLRPIIAPLRRGLRRACQIVSNSPLRDPLKRTVGAIRSWICYRKESDIHQ